MKIENLRTECHNGRARVSADVIWEDCGRPADEVYFETDSAFADSLTCNPHAFLVGCSIPAMHYGEKRVFIDAEVCPELREGLQTVFIWLRQWYYTPQYGIPDIEVRGLLSPSREPKPERAGFFFSGGVDSFATLLSNRLHFPPGHPRSIRDGILVYGLEQDDPENFRHVLHSLSIAADRIGFTLIPVSTNIYLNFRREDAANGFAFWLKEFGGAALAAVAHALAKRLTIVSIAATYSPGNIEPWSSHPLIDPNYGSYRLRILHDNVALTRHEKIRLVAGSDVALQHLRVCNRYKQYAAGMLNCSDCEKCLRTMLALMGMGALDKTPAFRFRDVTGEQVMKRVDIKHDPVFLKPIYEEMLAPLAAAGRHDLVRAVRYKIDHTDRLSWKEKIIGLDRKYFSGRLARMRRIFAGQISPV